MEIPNKLWFALQSHHVYEMEDPLYPDYSYYFHYKNGLLTVKYGLLKCHLECGEYTIDLAQSIENLTELLLLAMKDVRESFNEHKEKWT